MKMVQGLALSELASQPMASQEMVQGISHQLTAQGTPGLDNDPCRGCSGADTYGRTLLLKASLVHLANTQ